MSDELVAPVVLVELLVAPIVLVVWLEVLLGCSFSATVLEVLWSVVFDVSVDWAGDVLVVVELVPAIVPLVVELFGVLVVV